MRRRGPAGDAGRLLAGAAVLGCLALTLGAPVPPAGGQTPPGERGDRSLSLDVARIDGIVTPDADLRVRVQVVNTSRHDREDLRLLATVHRDPIGRFNYQQAMDGGELGGVIHGFSQDVGDVPSQGSRTIDLRQTADELGLARPAGQDGVYPLRIQLLSAGEVVDEGTTNLVFSEEEVAFPVAVSLLLPIAAPPSRDGQGRFMGTALAGAVSPSQELGGLAEVLASRPDLPVTLGVDPLTLEEAADLASGFLLAGVERSGPTTRPPDSPEAERAGAFLDTVREMAARPVTQLLAQPYASADLVALERHGLASELGRHVSDGTRTVEALAGERPVDTVLWPPDGIDRDTLVTVRGLGVHTLVLGERFLRVPGPRGERSPSPVRRLRAGPGITMTALVPDPWLEQTLVDGLEAPLLAQRILGEIATLYFEVPAIDGRGLLVAAPPDTPVDPVLVGHLADGIAAAPFAEPATITTLGRRVEQAETTVGLDYPADTRRAELPTGYLADLERARQALGSLDGVLVDDPATPARFDRLLLQAASVHYRSDLDGGRGLLSAITTTVDDLYGAVDIPDVPPVTLTSVEGQLPVTVRSGAAVPMRVLLHLRTPTYEIEGGPTRELVLEPDSAQLLTFQVRALRPGRTDGVQVVVTDADGIVELASGTVVVRSTAFSVTGLVVTAGAALFLLGWGMREAARRRRGPGDLPERRSGAARRLVSRSVSRGRGQPPQPAKH